MQLMKCEWANSLQCVPPKTFNSRIAIISDFDLDAGQPIQAIEGSDAGARRFPRLAVSGCRSIGEAALLQAAHERLMRRILHSSERREGPAVQPMLLRNLLHCARTTGSTAAMRHECLLRRSKHFAACACSAKLALPQWARCGRSLRSAWTAAFEKWSIWSQVRFLRLAAG